MPCNRSRADAAARENDRTSCTPTKATAAARSKNRQACRRRGIVPRIARPGVESKERLGRHRWKVERTFAWLHRYRRLLIRWERRAVVHLGFLQLACCLIAFNFVRGGYC